VQGDKATEPEQRLGAELRADQRDPALDRRVVPDLGGGI
jgi:hypothetical protein